MPRDNTKELFKPYGFDKPLLILFLILLAFGLIMVFSSSAILASEKYQNSLYFFIHQVIGAGLGLLLLIVLLAIKKPFYQDPAFIYGLLLVSLVLLALCFVMPSVENTNRWISFAGLRFQPSELSKLTLVLFFASYFSRKQDKIGEWQTLVFPLGVLSLFILLILKEPDYGTALLVMAVSAVLLYIGGVKLKHLFTLGIASIAVFGFYLFQASYRVDRIFAFVYPDRDPQGVGFQAIQSKLAVGSGGLFGVSLGESTQKLFFLPCAHTDYIFAIIGEEFGLIGTIAVLLLFTVFLWRGLLISWRAPNLFCQIAAAGITLAIFFQALLNITIVIGLGPPTGLPLPIISYGRSSLLTTILSIGILLHISQRRLPVKKKR
ncbi:MAG: putative lipid II flippase FtsW [Candidatus Aminicenantes bacterium]|jgi:cell division protein FtsW